jgi:hypothetical protein
LCHNTDYQENKPMAKTQHDTLCAGLEALGGVRQPKRNKYTVLKLGVHYYFVDKAGALRIASRQNAAASIPCNDRFRQHVIDAQSPTALLEAAGL